MDKKFALACRKFMILRKRIKAMILHKRLKQIGLVNDKHNYLKHGRKRPVNRRKKKSCT